MLTDFDVVTDTYSLAGGDRVHLCDLGSVGDLRYSTAWPGGCLDATFTLDLPLHVEHRALQLGRRAEIYLAGGRVWAGKVTAVVKGYPWQVTFSGIAAEARNYEAIFSTLPPPTGALSDATAGAITRGLPWTNLGGLPNTPAGLTLPDTPGKIADLFDMVSAAAGKQWGVWADYAPVMRADPTSPSWLVDVVDEAGGRTLDEFATVVIVRYLDSTTNAITNVITPGSSAAIDRWGRLERTVDVTDRGAMSAGSATALGLNALAVLAPRPSFTGGSSVPSGHVYDIGGVQASAALVRAGDMVRYIGTQPDAGTGEINFLGALDVVIGQTEYDATTDVVQITPTPAAQRDLSSLLATVVDRFAPPVTQAA